MRHTVELPALDGREPLGFLAALGTLRLLAEHANADVRLYFSDHTGTAQLVGPWPDLHAIAQALIQIATQPDSLIPGTSPDFLQAKSGSGADPMRVERTRLRHAWPDNPADARWMSVLLTDLAADSAGRAALTPYTAPSGQQSLRTFFEKPTIAVRAEPSRIYEALAGWRRVDGFTGEYLDHHVLRSAADDPLGRVGQEAGVPGATWLAIMALPLLHLTGDGRNPAATLWHRIPGRREPIMIWPLWRRPLDVAAVQVLVEHPALTPKLDSGHIVLRRDAGLDALDVFLVAAAERQRIRGRNFAGVLAPVPTQLT